MPNSMTGFARVDETAEWGNVVCELKSVNHRFLDLSFRISDSLRAAENELREKIRGHLARGKVECSISIKLNGSGAAQMRLDPDVAQSYIDATSKLSDMLNTNTPINPTDILRMQGVMVSQEVDNAEVKALAMQALSSCLKALSESRQREGNVLGKEVLMRTEKIRQLTLGLSEIAPAIRKNYEAKMHRRIEDANIEVSAERLEQELIFIAQKMDIEEEIDRLHAHLDQIDELVASNQPIGRKLDFLMQELNREANTLGSKSQGLQQTNSSVEMKVLIEQIREQIQNIE